MLPREIIKSFAPRLTVFLVLIWQIILRHESVVLTVFMKQEFQRSATMKQVINYLLVIAAVILILFTGMMFLMFRTSSSIILLATKPFITFILLENISISQPGLV